MQKTPPRILPIRSVGRNGCRGTLKLTQTSSGTMLEPALPRTAAEGCAVYAVLRGGGIEHAKAEGGAYYAAAVNAAGALITKNGQITGAAFAQLSQAEREKACTAVRLAEAARANGSANAKAASPAQKQAAAPHGAAYGTAAPAAPAAANNDPPLKSEIARRLAAQANRLFAPPDANAEPFMPRPYERDAAPIAPASTPTPLPPANHAAPACPRRTPARSGRRR